MRLRGHFARTKIVFALQPDHPGLRGHAAAAIATGWSGQRSPSGVVGPFSLFPSC